MLSLTTCIHIKSNMVIYKPVQVFLMQAWFFVNVYLIRLLTKKQKQKIFLKQALLKMVDIIQTTT